MFKRFAIKIFGIKRSEAVFAVVILLLLLFWHGMIISKFWALFAEYDVQQWERFMRNYHMSGFDPLSYKVITRGSFSYDILRHPLLTFMMYPLFWLNQLVWGVTGANCCQLFFGALLLFCGFYGNIFLYRIMHEEIGIPRRYATLLGVCFLGFAYILLSMIVADHFGLSFFCIMLTLWMAAGKLRKHETFSVKECVLLYLITSGITLSNGILVLIAVLWVNGKAFFNWKYLLKAVALPTLLLGIVAFSTFGYEKNSETSKAVSSQWKDVSQKENRVDILVENFMGESIQLHRKFILGDVLVSRPVIVEYSWTEQYYAELAVALLFLAGILVSWREKLMQICLAILLFTLMLHIVLGFAIQEVYIMTAHWAFVIPVAWAYLYTKTNRVGAITLSLLFVSLAAYLWSYHSVLLYNYLTWPVK